MKTPTPANTGISYAYQNRHTLPGAPSQSQSKPPKLRDAFNQSRDQNTQSCQQRREAFMVKRDQPKPSLRPAPQMAYGPDRAAFDQRWESEHQAAKPKRATPSREKRKEAFKKARNEQTQTRAKTLNHDKKGR